MITNLGVIADQTSEFSLVAFSFKYSGYPLTYLSDFQNQYCISIVYLYNMFNVISISYRPYGMVHTVRIILSLVFLCRYNTTPIIWLSLNKSTSNGPYNMDHMILFISHGSYIIYDNLSYKMDYNTRSVYW